MPHTAFTATDFAAFRADDRPGPIHMLNLVRLHDRAEYPADHTGPRMETGRDAYAAYGRLSAPVFARLGGRIVWRGRMEHMLIGPPDTVWDLCFVAEYPSVGAFVAMIKDPDYRQAMVHRQAAVADSRLIRTAPLTVGDGFTD